MLRYELGPGRALTLEDAPRKLTLRARLPGAHLFDRATHALRQARALGLPLNARLELALASSWLVNSPAPSSALRALAEPARFTRLGALAESLANLASRAGDMPEATMREVEEAVDQLSASWPDARGRGAEMLSKLLALVVPETVPLLPEPACRFLLGAPPAAEGARFTACLNVFRRATLALEDALVEVARAHDATVLEPAQVLDRVLWFDSEGYRHFP
jgi:hypothetical protein